MDVVGIGYPVMDCLVRVERLPERDELVQMKELSWQGGGMVSTGLVALSVLGASAGMIGMVGGDRYGTFCIRDFEQNGVDISHLITDPDGTTNFTIVLSVSGDKSRNFIGSDGTRRALRLDELDEAYIAGARYLLVTDMDEVTIAACRFAKKHGVKVVIDADIYDKRTVDNLDLIDVFIASEIFYSEMYRSGSFRENCADIRSRGPDIAFVTLGERGCAGMFASQYMEVPAFTDVPIVDTTGAGDVFHGAFIYGLLQRWGGEEVARFASAVAAVKCTQLGGRAGIPSRRIADHFLQTGEIPFAEMEPRLAMYRQGVL